MPSRSEPLPLRPDKVSERSKQYWWLCLHTPVRPYLFFLEALHSIHGLQQLIEGNDTVYIYSIKLYPTILTHPVRKSLYQGLTSTESLTKPYFLNLKASRIHGRPTFRCHLSHDLLLEIPWMRPNSALRKNDNSAYLAIYSVKLVNLPSMGDLQGF